MATCAWCGKTRKTLKLDSQDRCEDCQDAARYPSRPTKSFRIRTADTDYMGAANGGRKTYPVGESFREEE